MTRGAPGERSTELHLLLMAASSRVPGLREAPVPRLGTPAFEKL
jgi:hypothetical protein